jgi:hypothetical protein
MIRKFAAIQQNWQNVIFFIFQMRLSLFIFDTVYKLPLYALSLCLLGWWWDLRQIGLDSGMLTYIPLQ